MEDQVPDIFTKALSKGKTIKNKTWYKIREYTEEVSS